MDLQIKLFNGLGRGNHVIVISRGLVDIDGFKEIFRNVANTTEFLLDCMILIDLQDATCRLEPTDIYAFAENLRPEYWPATNRVALVSVPGAARIPPTLRIEHVFVEPGDQKRSLQGHQDCAELVGGSHVICFDRKPTPSRDRKLNFSSSIQPLGA